MTQLKKKSGKAVKAWLRFCNLFILNAKRLNNTVRASDLIPAAIILTTLDYLFYTRMSL